MRKLVVVLSFIREKSIKKALKEIAKSIFPTSSFILLPCIVISVVAPQVGQMIDLGFSVNEMMDECLPLTLRVGDYNEKIFNRYYQSLSVAQLLPNLPYP